nr:putative replication associated protein [Crucivirus sp.]
MSEIAQKPSKSINELVKDVVVVKTKAKAAKPPSEPKAPKEPKVPKAPKEPRPPKVPKAPKEPRASKAPSEEEDQGPPTKARGYCFTINNYSPEEVESFRAYAVKIDYAIFGYEVAPTTGTPHMQCYMNHNNTIRFQTLRKLFPRAANIVQAKGTAKQNQIYCKKGVQSKEEYTEHGAEGPNYGKDAVWEEFGECPETVGSGHRTDLDIIGQQLREGKTTVEKLATELPTDTFHRYLRTFSYYEHHYLRNKRRTGPPRCFFLYGTTGSAKTREFTNGIPEEEIYTQPKDSLKFSGYAGQRAFIMNEVRHTVPFEYLLDIADPTVALTVEVKNERKHIQMTAEIIVITSCSSPEELYPEESRERMLQFYRRYICVEMNGNDRNVIVDEEVYKRPFVDHPNFISEVVTWEGTKQECEQRLQDAFASRRKDKALWAERMAETKAQYDERRRVEREAEEAAERENNALIRANPLSDQELLDMFNDSPREYEEYMAIISSK